MNRLMRCNVNKILNKKLNNLDVSLSVTDYFGLLLF